MRGTAILLLAAAASAGEIAEDKRFEPGVRRLAEPLRVTADSVVVDFGEAVFEGSDADTPPDRFEGIGLIVEGRRKVTIRGGRFRGFKCAILVKDCREVVLIGVDVSGNFAQRLRSTPEREDPSDWLWPHENDEQQWRRNYGAGICLEGCRDCEVRGCTGRRQQNGILLDHCEGCGVYDNDMSFLSGWGLGMWRSSKNTVARNRFDWCVRGYSHGVYDRGQDSAGILVFEQCSRNVFFRNSATHGGDGFFLYAGNETLRRTGRGGCNDNLVQENDFSHAVANGIEATFSRGNRFSANTCVDCNYGIWAGYSYESVFDYNRLSGSIAGIAIEHGTKNRVFSNILIHCPRGIQLWWDHDEDLLKSAFGKARSCLSRDYDIHWNTFLECGVALHLKDTSAIRHGNHSFKNVEVEVQTEGRCEGVEQAPGLAPEPPAPPLDLPGTSDPFLPEGHPRGREHILVGEWGPLDPTESAVFPGNVVAWGACAFHVLGAKGGYEIEGLPEGLRAEKGDRTFRVRGGTAGLTPFSCRVKVGGKSFPVSGSLLRAEWRVRFWEWKKDPREDPDVFATEPLAEITSDRLDFVWKHGAPAPRVPTDRFATRAAARMQLPAGRYELRTRSDDGVRVIVDGHVVQEDWTWHAPKENRTTVDLPGGEHLFLVEHFEIDGYAVLGFDLRPIQEPEDAYRGKYALDHRFLAVRDRLSGLVEEARAKIAAVLGTEIPALRIRFEDGSPHHARVEAGEDGPVLRLGTEHLVLGTHDLSRTLVHELYHGVQQERLGAEAHFSLPPWVREGAALYVAGQLEDRARVLGSHWAGAPDALVRIAPGLDQEHDLNHYAFYACAFEAAEARHGREKTVALLRRFLADADAARVVREVLGEDLETFGRETTAFARTYLAPFLKENDADGAYRRAKELQSAGRHAEALAVLRTGFFPRRRESSRVPDAVLLELRLLRALESPAFESAAARARLDLRPFGVHAELLQFLEDR